MSLELLGEPWFQIVTLCGGVVLLTFLIVWNVVGVRRGKLVIERWAAGHGYQIVYLQVRRLLRGPFFWNSNQVQIVFRLSVQNSAGRIFDGWARCGTMFRGPFAEKIDLVWDPLPTGFDVIPTDKRSA